MSEAKDFLRGELAERPEVVLDGQQELTFCIWFFHSKEYDAGGSYISKAAGECVDCLSRCVHV